jgi:hypothetical protein
MYYGVHLCLPDHSLEQIAQGHEAHPNEQQNQYLVHAKSYGSKNCS